MFDHDGDGVRTASGWTSPDDGLLVLDRNGNGQIDGGQELFGADTVMSDGTLAQSGFEALADLDSNGDGVFDASDAEFGNVRVWRDLNQDGVSQANELFTLDQVGIAAINLTPTSTVDVNLGNGNIIDNSGVFIRNDGATGLAGDMLFAMNNFYRDFSGSLNPVEVSEAAAALPGLRGSGAVRDLAEAATLSPALLAAVQALNPDMTRAQMLAQVQLLIGMWADTSTMETSEQELEGAGNRTVYFHGAVPADVLAQGAAAVQAWREQQHAQLAPVIAILERFNGSTLFSLDGESVSTGGRTFFWQTLPDGSQVMNIEFSAEHLALIMRAYDALQESVYGGLVMRTRLSDYLDLVTLEVDAAGGIVWNSAALVTALVDLRSTDPVNAMVDLLDLSRHGAGFAAAIGFDVTGMVYEWVAEWRETEAGREILQQAGLNLSQGQGTGGDDMIEGGAGNDTLSAGAGDDLVFGDAGDDSLSGEAGNDVLFGGVGNDSLDGGTGNDTYVIRAGDGVDTLSDYQGADRVVFEGLNAADVLSVERHGDMLVLRLANGQQLNLQWYFYSADYQIETLQFADGTTWGGAELLDRLVVPGTAANDSYTGTGLVDRMFGYEGNDHLDGRANDDVLDGGAGADSLLGDAGNDTLIGGTDNDSLQGGVGNDTYVIRAGDGVDTLSDHEGVDKVVFEGLNAADVQSVERHGDMLVLRLANGQQLNLQYYFYSADYQIESFAFADGTAWTNTDILDRLVVPGTAGNDSYTGTGLVDRMFGYEGNDYLDGRGNDDILDGGIGDDSLLGDAGNDVLIGGVGDDTMSGGVGNDTYVIRAGDGIDSVYDYQGTDKVVFEGLNAADVVSVERHGDALVLRLANGQQLNLQWYFYSADYQIEALQFADGTTWDYQSILQRVATPGTANGDSLVGSGNADWIIGYAGNDRLDGRGNDDLIDGGEGDDALLGDAGNDTLIGGVGNDSLDGGTGNDTYVIRTGDGIDLLTDYQGADRIVFEDLNAADVLSVERHGDMLVLRLANGQQLNLQWYFYSADYQIETLQFADGTTWGSAELLDRLVVPGTAGNDSYTGTGLVDRMFGYEGNDYLDGRGNDDVLDGGAGADSLLGDAGDDTLIGGIGNDSLDGGVGNDTYVIRAGDGIDLLTDYQGADRIVFEGLNAADVQSVERHGDMLVLRLANGQQLNLQWYFYSADYQIETLQFADGTTWGSAELLDRLVVPGTAANDSYTGTGLVDRMFGYEGNDYLDGRGNDDVLDGGIGDDSLLGDAGNDVLIGGEGNDALNGGVGNDTYVIRAGDGIDSVYDYQGVDKVVFEGLNAADVQSVERHGDMLVLRLANGQQLNLQYYFYSADYQIESFAFADGTAWTNADILDRLIVPGTAGNDSYTGTGLVDRMFGYEGNDHLDGRANDDVLDGGAGADSLLGDAGNDTLIGGIGNDSLDGGVGNDTYVIRLSDGIDSVYDYQGNDRLVFEDFDPSQVTSVERQGSHLVMTMVDGQQLTVSWFFYSADYQVESFEFADGTVWDAAEVTAIADGLIDAMAAYGPTYGSSGDTLPPVHPQPVVLAPAA
ncbi:calcium-binding protein [Arenimonas terrae]|uniref:calcium-binding protein n=1 Tax=Arenimonas terrae TaxID=2546226 RepID=UPI001C709D6D|nr:calcium-binding protein [Arenimonas terrae]